VGCPSGFDGTYTGPWLPVSTLFGCCLGRGWLKDGQEIPCSCLDQRMVSAAAHVYTSAARVVFPVSVDIVCVREVTGWFLSASKNKLAPSKQPVKGLVKKMCERSLLLLDFLFPA
jgi:hypothetical protein